MQGTAIMPVQSGPRLFILSCERSGSTLLRYIADTHPRIACPGHVYLGRLCHSLYYSIESSLGHTFSDNKAQKEAVILAEVRDVVENMMARYAAAKNKDIWCEKTPMNLEYRDILVKAFPEAHYLCLYRHCLDVVYSCIGLRHYRYLPEHIPYVQHRPDNLVAAMMSNWIDKTAQLLDFEKQHNGITHRILYERLVQNTDATLTAVFSGLGLDWDEVLTDQVFRQAHDAGEGDAKVRFSRGISAQSVGRGIEIPRDLIPGDLEKKADMLLAELGYPSIAQFYVEHSAGNTLASPKVNTAVGELLRDLGERKANLLREAPSLHGHVCKFIITGDDGGAWAIDTVGFPVISTAKEGGAFTSTIALSSELMVALAEGRRNPMEAYEEGKIQVTGDLDAAFEVGRILFA